MIVLMASVFAAVLILFPFLKVAMDIHAAIVALTAAVTNLQTKLAALDPITAAEKQAVIDAATTLTNVVSTL